MDPRPGAGMQELFPSERAERNGFTPENLLPQDLWGSVRCGLSTRWPVS